jgi:hypothetical protein
MQRALQRCWIEARDCNALSNNYNILQSMAIYTVALLRTKLYQLTAAFRDLITPDAESK